MPDDKQSPKEGEIIQYDSLEDTERTPEKIEGYVPGLFSWWADNHMPGTTSSQLRSYTTLCSLALHNTRVWVSDTCLASVCQRSERTIKRGLKHWEEQKLIIREKRYCPKYDRVLNGSRLVKPENVDLDKYIY